MKKEKDGLLPQPTNLFKGKIMGGRESAVTEI